MEIKALLEQTGIPTKETLFLKAPAYPYQVYFDTKTFGGADIANLLIEHEVRLELYTERVDAETESKVEQLLNSNGIPFSTDSREYIKSEDHYQKFYYFTLTEKLRTANG